MRLLPVVTLSISALLTCSCSQAQSDEAASGGKTGKKKEKQESLENRLIEESIPGLRRTGSLNNAVPESSGLARADQSGTFYTHGDAGNSPILYKIDATGKLLYETRLSVPNQDWESLAQDNRGNLFVVDAGNNNNSRQDLAIYRLNPASPKQIGTIRFTYADQRKFPPAKSERNFDCEAALWHDGMVYLFTRDRANQTTSKVYAVSDKPGQQTARLLTSLPINGEVTDADLSPDGKRLALLGKEELFLYEGDTFQALLKATPQRINLPGVGQTEGIVFTDSQTLVISTEEGSIYQYTLQGQSKSGVNIGGQ
ncbi:hypothetical protein SAMN00120144_0890 [Hymenobacter roseosalivarius DSM 11622]|uniref:Uncharacterized protein n=1 Tax=Hymenobacter roseosalivarius DSM 11622 TaxID=645990 RepID=A0A1W1V752_9BACT|nr:hypothetical protein [Hymenobacter roseosalivarius]SMB89259.1 hypothetical protein SAMN00120144_0890 [Hymenobacter roseosalivarius DSM 11622]